MYADTFSSRAGITARNGRLALKKVVIVGLGGTGSYLLDFLTKTPIEAIHLYDDDTLKTHNAFRSPGAATLGDLRASKSKVEYYASLFGEMHRGIHPHAVRVTVFNVAEIADADFVFLAMDSGPEKMTIMEQLIAARVPFIDSGVGVSDDPNGIAGHVRVTTSTPDRSDHIARDGLISYFAGEAAEYDTNLQVSELNALAAVQSVLRFKKILGFYADAEDERHSVYVTDSNEIHNRYGENEPAPFGIAEDHAEDAT
ncbi:MAG: ThiF family adenylyltransferase [Micropruina sp.]|nr:ThiF family adenylyltransferase [Micropruina sp.]